jgi:hypothetical protein
MAIITQTQLNTGTAIIMAAATLAITQDTTKDAIPGVEDSTPQPSSEVAVASVEDAAQVLEDAAQASEDATQVSDATLASDATQASVVLNGEATPSYPVLEDTEAAIGASSEAHLTRLAAAQALDVLHSTLVDLLLALAAAGLPSTGE